MALGFFLAHGTEVMTPERWRRIEAVYHAALECDPGQQRQAYLADACAGDEDLRREVESLLA
jgi:serine/threonine-protein kinase